MNNGIILEKNVFVNLTSCTSNEKDDENMKELFITNMGGPLEVKGSKL